MEVRVFNPELQKHAPITYTKEGNVNCYTVHIAISEDYLNNTDMCDVEVKDKPEKGFVERPLHQGPSPYKVVYEDGEEDVLENVQGYWNSPTIRVIGISRLSTLKVCLEHEETQCLTFYKDNQVVARLTLHATGGACAHPVKRLKVSMAQAGMAYY